MDRVFFLYELLYNKFDLQINNMLNTTYVLLDRIEEKN